MEHGRQHRSRHAVLSARALVIPNRCAAVVTQPCHASPRMMVANLIQPWNAERVATLLNKVRRTPNGWHACCPAHEDRNPSFFMADGKDGLALVCYAGCSYRDIVQALEAKGAQLTRKSDGIPETHFQLGEYHQHWDYRDAGGRTVMRICRWQQPGGRKDIRPLTLTPEGWKWIAHPAPRPLFQLDRLAADPDKPVIVVEGEKTAHAGQRLFPDYIVTTWPGGAQAVGQADWTPLQGRALILIPDCDTPGRKAMAWVREHIKALAKTIRTVDPGEKVSDLSEGWDLADALQEDRDVSGWLEEAQPQRRLLRMCEILANPTRPQWLIRDVIEQGIIAILLGPRGTYKSFIALHWALTVAVEGSPVVIVSGEGRGLDRRLKAWLTRHAPNVKPHNVPVYALEQRVDFNSDESTVALCAEIDALEIPPVLIVIDTLSKNSGGLDENSNSEVRAFIGRLDLHLKRRYGATVLLIHHTGHSDKGRARGASAIEADTDAAYVIERIPAERTVKVSRERFKDSGELPPLTYRADIIDLGELDDDGRPVTSLALASVDSSTDVTEKRGTVPRGLRQRELLGALRALQQKSNGPLVWGPAQLRQIARDLGMKKQTAQDTASAVAIFYLKPTIGGYSLHDPPRSESPKSDHFGPVGPGSENPVVFDGISGPPTPDPFSDRSSDR